MGKSTINLGHVLNQLTSPMEKVASEEESKKEEAVEAKSEEKSEEKESEELEEEDKEESYAKEDKSEEEKKEYKEEMAMDKEASVNPVSGLEKIAADLAEVEHKTMIKEAQVFGSVMADSFAGRLSEIQTVLDKTAAVEEVEFDKTAAEHDYMEKVATELFVNMDESDQAMVTEMVKVAAENGHNISNEEAFSVLADQAIAEGEAYAMQKVATEEAMTKLAGEDHVMLDGFTKTAQLMGETEFTKEAAFHYLSNKAMTAGAEAANGDIEKVAAEQAQTETPAQEPSGLEAMEKVANEMEAAGNHEGVAELEKYAYDKGFEDTIMKVASQTSGIAYEQTQTNFPVTK